MAVNQEIRMTPELAERHAMLQRLPRQNPRLLVAVGAAEPAGWVAQSEAYAQACAEVDVPARLLQVAGANHFTVMEQLLNPGSQLARALLGMVAKP